MLLCHVAMIKQGDDICNLKRQMPKERITTKVDLRLWDILGISFRGAERKCNVNWKPSRVIETADRTAQIGKKKKQEKSRAWEDHSDS